MMIVRFRKEEHKDTLKKVKKMKKFLEDIEEIFEDCVEDEEDDVDYRSPRYRHEYDEDDMMSSGRYAYRRGGRRM